jgi:hypothetical protein
MRRTPLLLALSGLLATLGGAWAGCYQSGSDCGLLLTCPGAGGSAGSSSSASTTSHASTGSGSTSSSSAATTSSGGTGGGASSSSASSSGGGTGMKGQSCKMGSDCASGLFCVDGFCCDGACTASCFSCAVPGKEGTCTGLPVGVDDSDTFCFMQAVCDVGQMCHGLGSLLPFGQACTDNTSCFNGVCQAGYCKLADGDPCGDDVSCRTGLCKNHICTTCTLDGDCASNHCNGGVCLLAGGEPCAVTADCAGPPCGGGYCNETGAGCDPASCPTHFCTDGGQCATCMPGDVCSTGLACDAGACLAPPGAYCETNGYCASGTCGPAALLSFPRCK